MNWFENGCVFATGIVAALFFIFIAPAVVEVGIKSFSDWLEARREKKR